MEYDPIVLYYAVFLEALLKFRDFLEVMYFNILNTKVTLIDFIRSQIVRVFEHEICFTL